MTTTAKTKKIVIGNNLSASKKFPESIVEGAICLDDLANDEVKPFIYSYKGKRYLNIKVIKRKEVSKFNKTHYIQVDTFVPEHKEG